MKNLSLSVLCVCALYIMCVSIYNVYIEPKITVIRKQRSYVLTAELEYRMLRLGLINAFQSRGLGKGRDILFQNLKFFSGLKSKL